MTSMRMFMRSKITWIGCGLLAAACAAVQLQAQRGGRGGTAQGAPTAGFPAQQRTPADASVIAHGKTLYELHCRLCHGPDLRGGEQGGSNLLRSAIALSDQSGELLQPVIRDGRRNPGLPSMPATDLPADDLHALAEYIHSVLATARGQGSPPPGPPVTLNVVVGNAAAGRAYFETKCASCHSTAGDLRGIGSRFADPTQLQNRWVAGGAGGGRGGATPTTATVTFRSGQKFEGQLIRADEFLIALALQDGTSRSFRRDGEAPKVEIHNPREGHLNLLPVYTDKDIHDVTAYLVTLK
jgi:cytochrome c oxidase cbb3-type subunit III